MDFKCDVVLDTEPVMPEVVSSFKLCFKPLFKRLFWIHDMTKVNIWP